MRAALPHLRLLTLPVDRLFLLATFLTAEEKIFLFGKMIFSEEKTEEEEIAPQGLNTNKTPRTRVGASRHKIVELIFEEWIITDHLEMVGKDVLQTPAPNEVFSVTFGVCQNLCLEGLQILTQANNNPKFRRVSGTLNK